MSPVSIRAAMLASSDCWAERRDNTPSARQSLCIIIINVSQKIVAIRWKHLNPSSVDEKCRRMCAVRVWWVWFSVRIWCAYCMGARSLQVDCHRCKTVRKRHCKMQIPNRSAGAHIDKLTNGLIHPPVWQSDCHMCWARAYCVCDHCLHCHSQWNHNERYQRLLLWLWPHRKV